jgi:hypothetical protein
MGHSSSLADRMQRIQAMRPLQAASVGIAPDDAASPELAPGWMPHDDAASPELATGWMPHHTS